MALTKVDNWPFPEVATVEHKGSIVAGLNQDGWHFGRQRRHRGDALIDCRYLFTIAFSGHGP